MKIISTLLLCLGSLFSYGQTVLNIHKTDGSTIQVPLIDIDSVNFTITPPPPAMNIYRNDGSVLAVILSEIDSITYNSPSPTNTVTDIDGNVYQTVIIGTQEWMAENLKTTHYADGNVIPNVIDNVAWANLSTGAWCTYGNDPTNDSIYGKLYNWYTVTDPSGVCPAGWHIPTLADWDVLYVQVGVGEGSGTKLKSTSGWNNFSQQSGNGNNESGFNGLPGGQRYCDGVSFFGDFYFVRSIGTWWSTDEYNTTSAYSPELSNGHSSLVTGASYNKKNGQSVRCLKN